MRRYPRGLDRRPRYESEADKLARRIREGTLPAQAVPAQAPEQRGEYTAKSASLAAAIARFRAESEAARKSIAVIEAAQMKRETAKLRGELIRAQQALQLAQVQEAVMLEEMEMLDVAFVASVALGVTIQ